MEHGQNILTLDINIYQVHSSPSRGNQQHMSIICSWFNLGRYSRLGSLIRWVLLKLFLVISVKGNFVWGKI